MGKQEIVQLRSQRDSLQQQLAAASEEAQKYQVQIRLLESELEETKKKSSSSNIRELFELRAQCASLKATVATLERRVTASNVATTTSDRASAPPMVAVSGCIHGEGCALYKLGRCAYGE